MNEIYPIAKLGSQILIVNKKDLPFIGKERAIEVKCVRVNLENAIIDEMLELEKHLKFNPWEEITSDEDRAVIVKILNTKFSDQNIEEKIIKVLEENKVR